MNLHKHQLYLLEQHSESFKIWSAIIRINTEGKSLIMKMGSDLCPHLLHLLLTSMSIFAISIFAISIFAISIFAKGGTTS